MKRAPGRSITFCVPLPPRSLSPNHDHKHWAKRSREPYRSAVTETAIVERVNNHWGSPARHVRVSLLFGTKHTPQQRQIARRDPNADYEPMDLGNAIAAFKAGFDGLVDAGLFIDDRHENMSLGSVRITDKDGPWVRVTIEETDGAE